MGAKVREKAAGDKPHRPGTKPRRGQARKFPSQHERQVKRILRGKKPNRKRRKIRDKRKMRVQPAWNRQTDSRNKTELRTQSARRAAAAQARQTGAKVCVKAAEKRRAGREQSGGTPQKKGRSLLGLHVKKQQKTCALCTKQTSRTDSAKEFPAHTQRLQKKRRGTGHKSPHNSGWPRKNGQPAIWRGAPDKKNPSEQAKRAFALLPARRGHVNRGRQKIASLFLAGTAFFCFALRTMPRAALHKRGRRPL